MIVYHRTPPETIADGLRRRGYQVYGPDHQDQYQTTTAICHGGDTPRGLSIGPDGDGGTLVYCYTRGCGSGGDMAQVLDRVREQAGIQPMVRAGGDRRHVATYTGEGRPDKRVYRQDLQGGGKKMSQDTGPMDGYDLLLWGDDADGNALVIVEGEKAAAALVDAGANAAGYTPASWVGGTAGVGKASYRLAAGRTVYLWPDNDAPGQKAMATAAQLCLESGAAGLLMVPVDGMPKKGDVADLPVDSRLVRLADAVEYEPELGQAVREKSDPAAVPGVAQARPFHKVNLSPLSDAMRLLGYCPDRLLVAEDRPSQSTELLLLNAVGIWERDYETLGGLMVHATTQWYLENIESRNPNLLAEGLRWVQRLRSDRGRSDAFAMVQEAYNLMADDGSLPPGLRYCESRDLDAQLTYIGTKSGVLDLTTGLVLSPADGAERLVSRSIPDPFDIDADSNPDVQRLLEHLPDDEREYLLSAVSFALRGSPARRWYLLHGPPASGKTTFLSAVGAALGSAKSGGYHAQLSLDALVQSRFATKNAHTEEIVDLPYARIASKSEMPRSGHLDIAMIKEMSGGGEKSIRGIHKAAQTVRRITATIIVAVNDADARRIDMTDDAFEDRTKILPYSPIASGPAGVDYLNRMQDDPRARMGVMAMLVKAGLGKDGPPADIASVREAMARQKTESLDEMGLWLRENVEYTGRARDVITSRDLWERMADAFSVETDVREIAGYNRKTVITLAKSVVPGFPSSRTMSVQGSAQRAYVGVRWTEPPAPAAEPPSRPPRTEPVPMPQTDCQLCGLLWPIDQLTADADYTRYCPDCWAEIKR